MPWATDHPLDAAAAATLVGAQFKDLAPVSAVYLGEGWDSVVFEVNRRWIFRFPKRAAVERSHDVERALLPRLGGKLPLPIPCPSRDGRPAPGFPFRFMGYERLEGTAGILLPLDAVDLDECGRQFGEFLTALHAFPLDEARSLGVPNGELDGRFASRREKVESRLHEFVDMLSPSLRRRARRFLDAPLPTSSAGEPCLVHDDLCDGHVLVDTASRRVAGVIDWGDLSVGDPASDFAGLWQWLGEPLVERVLRSYRGPDVDRDVLARVRASATFVGFSTLWYGVRGGRPEFVASGLRSLDHSLPA